MTTTWTIDFPGPLRTFLSPSNPKGAVEQLDQAYAFAGGWCDFHGFTLKNHDRVGKATLLYPGDPPMKELSRTTLRDETVILFQMSWVAVVQRDGSHRISRMD